MSNSWATAVPHSMNCSKPVQQRERGQRFGGYVSGNGMLCCEGDHGSFCTTYLNATAFCYKALYPCVVIDNRRNCCREWGPDGVAVRSQLVGALQLNVSENMAQRGHHRCISFLDITIPSDGDE